MTKKYSYKDDFEMLILRHDYLTKIENPDQKWISEFEPIVKTTAGIMFDKLYPNFAKVGYDLEDIEMIANCYMIAYMGLYSLRNNNDARKRVNAVYQRKFGRAPTGLEIARKERINMISFLRQKLQYASVICARKARNITVDCDKRAVYAMTAVSKPATNELIYEKGTELGYRKVQNAELKEIKKLARKNKAQGLIDEFGYPIIEIEMLSEGITEADYRDLFLEDKNDFYHNSPEELYDNVEKEVYMANITEEFFNMSSKDKRNCLSNFIDLYKDNRHYKTELKTARSMLRDL